MKAERKKKLDNFDIHKFHKEFEESVKKGNPMESMAPLFKMLLEATLEGELDGHLNSEEEIGNRRNGKSRKTVKSPAGSFELVVPRDRESSFEPQIIAKRQTENWRYIRREDNRTLRSWNELSGNQSAFEGNV